MTTPTAKPGLPPPPAHTLVAPAQAPLQMAQVSARGQSGCYMGRPLSGKTTWLCSWPGNVIWSFDPPGATGTALGHASGLPVVSPTLDDFHDRVLPAIQYREVERLVQGIVRGTDTPYASYVVRANSLDSWSHYQAQVVSHYLAKFPGDTRAAWGQIRERCMLTQRILANSTVPDRNGKYYHYLATVHEEEFEGEVADAKGNKRMDVVEVGATLQGGFYKVFFSSFSFVVHCVPAGGGYVVRSKATNLRSMLGDRSGYAGKLPPECAGDYATMAKHWGLGG